MEWHCNGQLHRTDGPAIIWSSGATTWYFLGQKHRTDGPAHQYADGGQEWWINGVRITPECI